ncbi:MULTISPECIES: J domain-containing protein [Halomonadaceae]|uniref:J domain-containing protein n=1 Tax=Halomonadaceae TaxID=28256 RepID=UPI001598FFA5|nr:MULTISPECIES: J domain-containing protein [Halomonas]QJQ95145.1 J domain-containing protein [Halomonas sp. PA5]
MLSFLSKIFGNGRDTDPQESTGLTCVAHDSNRKSGRREPPKELDWSQAEYVPLPPSPPTWEVDGRDEFHREYNDPSIGPVFQAGFKNQHSKVVKLAGDLPQEQRQGRVGEVIAKAYAKLIMRRMKSGQLAAAAKQAVEMFERVPEHVKDVDRRRFNRILKEMEKSGKKHGYSPVDVASPSSLPLFKASEDAPWKLVGERKLNSDERPDPAFTIAAIDARGTWLLDRSGASADRSEVKSVLRRMDRLGCLVGEKALLHDAYRTGTGGAGSGIAIMDSSGLLHVYNEELNIVTESNLREDSRVVDHFRTIDTNYWGEFKSQVRAVDVSPEGDRYLFTLADETWCCTASGRAAWGLVMPLKEGWKRVVGRSERFGVAQEVEEALRLFSLSLPVDPTDIKRKYRKLAQAHHPDRNAGDPAATEKMKALNAAFEILTGVDPNTLGYEESDVTYFARAAPDYVMELEGFRLEISMTGGVPQDWVYAASFAVVGGGAYLATYSGKVILVSREGRPEVVYDIGTCPNEIVDVDRYTYFLTPTRLYIIEDSTKLSAFLDVFQQGRLLVTQVGFGLHTGKRLQWFTHAGVKTGELMARDPIRTIYATDSGVVVQTRQHQVEIQGLLM